MNELKVKFNVKSEQKISELKQMINKTRDSVNKQKESALEIIAIKNEKLLADIEILETKLTHEIEKRINDLNLNFEQITANLNINQESHKIKKQINAFDFNLNSKLNEVKLNFSFVPNNNLNKLIGLGELRFENFNITMSAENTSNDLINSIVLIGHTNAIKSLVLLENGQLASGSWDNTIKIWDINTSSQLNELNYSYHTSIWSLLALSEYRLVSGVCDSKILVWDLNQKSIIQILKGHSQSVVCFVLIDSIYLASGSSDLSIRLWNIINGVCLKVLKGHTGCINALIEWRPMNTASFNNNNTLWNSKLISASSDKSIRVCNIDYSKAIW